MSRLPVSLTSFSLRQPLRALGVVAAACAVAVAVSACGGGSQASKFRPTRVVSFGDDSSFLTSAGKKYTVNAVATDESGRPVDSSGNPTASETNFVYICGNNPLWVQSVAAAYGFDGEQCPVSGATRAAYFLANDPTTTVTDATGAFSGANAATAQTNAGIAAVIARIGAPSSTALLNSGTLVLVMAGQPDVFAAYARWKAGDATLSSLQNDMKNLGISLSNALAQHVKPSGARVALVRVPRLLLTPLVQALPQEDKDVIAALTVALNDGMTNQAEVDFDGRQLTLVRSDDLTQLMFNSTSRSSYGISNSTDIGCAVPAGGARALTAPLCNTSYVDGGVNTQGSVNSTVSSVYLWSDATHFAPQAHSRLASLVISNVNRNPF